MDFKHDKGSKKVSQNVLKEQRFKLPKNIFGFAKYINETNNM